jgi:hypothetical protein
MAILVSTCAKDATKNIRSTVFTEDCVAIWVLGFLKQLFEASLVTLCGLVAKKVRASVVKIVDSLEHRAVSNFHVAVLARFVRARHVEVVIQASAKPVSMAHVQPEVKHCVARLRAALQRHQYAVSTTMGEVIVMLKEMTAAETGVTRVR